MVATNCIPMGIPSPSYPQGNTNFLGPDFWRPVVKAVYGTIVECNTAYGDRFGGVRDNTESP